MRIAWTTDLQSKAYHDALKIRHQVFVEEQKVPIEIEIDRLENETTHLVLYENNKAVATARIYHLADGAYKLQRVAVLKDYRKLGLGARLISEIEKKIQKLDGSKMVLGSQNNAIPFYQKLGFEIIGNEFFDAGIPHHMMEKYIIVKA